MQLRLQRSQRAGGLTGSTIHFCLDVRADYSEEERSNINKYKLGGQGLYNSRAAQKHFANAQAQLDRTQAGDAKSRAAGLVKGAFSMALAHMQLNVTIASLGRGHHIECKDLSELLEAEDTLRTACKDLTRYLEVAETFNGSELVVEYVNGEEQVHIAQHQPPLLEYVAPESSSGGTSKPAAAGASPSFDVEAWVREQWGNPQARKVATIAGGAVVLLLLLRSCFG